MDNQINLKGGKSKMNNNYKKCFVFFVFILMVIPIATIDCAWAGEKIKVSVTSVETKWHPIEVGDEEGHIVAVFENTNVYLSDKNGENPTGLSTGIIDMNVKTGKGTMKGYVVTTYPNGDKLYTKTEGQLIGNGQTEGTGAYVGGTGNLEGVKGSTVWRSKSLAPGISLMEIEGEREIPGK
jgi:hypothetical protein